MRRAEYIVGVILAVISIVAPAVISYDLRSKGAIPPKKLELRPGMSFNVLTDLSKLGGLMPVKVTIGGSATDNLVVCNATLTNKGSSPITPQEFHSKLSVSVDAPFEILAVESRGVEELFKFERVNKRQFDAAPALLNPGDAADVTVYLTNPNGLKSDNALAALVPTVPIHWSVRIENLSSLSKPEVAVDLSGYSSGWLFVHVSGWRIPALLFVFVTCVACYLYLLQAGHLIRMEPLNWKSGGLIVGVALLSICAAESATDIAMGISWLYDPLNWTNYTVLAAQIAVSVVLLWKARRRTANADRVTE